jgi:deoxyribonuclease-4
MSDVIVPRIGIHTSTAGGIDQAAVRALELGANCFQVFSASPRMWRAAPPQADAIARLMTLRRDHDLKPLVVHDNYLINLASADPVIRRKSIAAYRGEIERALAVGADYLVAHPGSYRGQSLEAGIEACAGGVREAAAGLKSRTLTLLIENTAGSGAAIGSRFEELAEIRRLLQRAGVGFRVGFCIDTCHAWAAGYDIVSEKGLEAVVCEIARILGLDHIPVIHANDSKGAFGSRLDRHANIGEGTIGRQGFRRILRHPALRDKAFILETPVDQEGDDRRNLRLLKRLASAPPRANKSL